MYPGAENRNESGARTGGNGCPPEPRQDAPSAAELEEWVVPTRN